MKLTIEQRRAALRAQIAAHVAAAGKSRGLLGFRHHIRHATALQMKLQATLEIRMSDDVYRFNGFYIPPRMMGGLRRYIDGRIPPGDFLKAVISNDLKEAVGRADDENLRNLPAYVAFLYNAAPGACWGSREKMDEWLAVAPTLPGVPHGTD